MDLPQIFWDAFRGKWGKQLASWRNVASDNTGRITAAWTELITVSAEESCYEFAERLGRNVIVGREKHIAGREKHGRLDVHAEDRDRKTLLVAFESELAYWGYNGSSGRDWREEFLKLCGVSAELRVLSSTFVSNTGADFSAFLRDRLEEMRAEFDRRMPGPFCLIFGPESPKKDPEQPWLAYSLEKDFRLRELVSAVPLRPRFVISGDEHSIEQ